MSPAVITLCVLAVAAFFFVTELIPLAVTAIGASIALGLLGVLTPQQVFSGLSDSTVVLFAGMFVIGAAMFQTGLAQKIGIKVVKSAGTSENRLMAALMCITILLSAVSSNTATVACLMPVVIQICAVAKIPVSPQLMALAVAANVGGTGLEPFGFFEFAYIGVPLSIAGMVYMLSIGRKFCPRRYVETVENDKASDEVKDPKKMIICTVILILVVLGMAFEKNIGIPMQTTAIIGALACVLTGCLSEKQAYLGIDWVTIFLFAGMLPLASAMDKSGAGKMIADGVVGIIGDNPSPMLIVVAMFILSCGLTQFMSNTAAAALLAPIGISIAQSIGASPYPVLMAIGIAASCAFTTPVATPPNTLVLIPGHFKFMDYVKVGLPLVVVSLVVCMIVIPFFWPFFP